MTDWSEERTRVSVGFASAFAIPKLVSDGPATLITTVFAVEPRMMNPAIITSLPVSTRPRVEMLARRGRLAGRLKVAVTAALAPRIIEQVPVPEQPAPDHPAKIEPDVPVAVSVTPVPEAKLPAHVGPQLIPVGLEVTVPLPDLDTVSVNPDVLGFTTWLKAGEVLAA